MPRRNDLHRILIIGSGPIVIGQACEFDYSGTQAAKALRADGYEVILVNSNPATIMTDPDLADKTYVEPLTLPYLEEIIRRERPDALLSTVGGQTGLNLAVELAEAGVLEKYGVELIGAKIDAIKKAEDRLLFKDAMRKIGLETPRSQLITTVKGGIEFASVVGYPNILRPSFTLGGTGGGIAYHQEELVEILERGLALSPVHEVLMEESALGWKEFELEVMRDLADNCIIVCSIENFDPMGVHTGDSITVAPAQTLTDREYQMMRDGALRCLREIGVDTGGSNVQFAINPANGRMVIIETPAAEPTGDLRERLARLGREIGERESAFHDGLSEARSHAEKLRARVCDALTAFHEAAAATGAPHLRVDVSGVRADDKHLRAVEFDLARGRHRAIVIAKGRGEVTLVGPFHAGKNEGPCLTFPFEAADEIERALGDFLEKFLREASSP